MIKKRIKAVKIIINITFRYILAFSLTFVPSYSYANTPSNTPSVDTINFNNPASIEQLITPFEEEYKRTQTEMPPELQEASKILREMGRAFTENRLKEYIDNKPDLKSKFDILSLSNQQVEILNYQEQTVTTVDFNQPNIGPVSYKRILKNIEVDFNPEGQMIFNGVVVSENPEQKLEKKIGLRHTFYNIKKQDIIDWVYDGEFLVLLHKKRGLILYHMMFAYELLGSTPIPSIQLNTPKLNPKEGIKLDFIDRSMEPPTQLSIENKNATVETNLDGKPMFSAGDLLISSNASGSKEIIRVFSRKKEFTHKLFEMYRVLESLIKVRDLSYSMEPEGRMYIEKTLGENILKPLLSATINNSSVSYFNKPEFVELIGLIPYFLLYKNIDNHPDRFLHTEWYKDYEKIKEAKPDIFKPEYLEEARKTGKPFSSSEIAAILTPIKQEKEAKKKSQFKEWFATLRDKFPKKNKMNTAIVLVVALWAILQSFSISGVDKKYVYISEVTYDMVLLGVGFLLIVTALGKLSIPFFKLIKKLPGLPPELKLNIDQAIEKWSGDNILVRDKITAFGFKAAAMLLPLIYRVFQVSGQSLLFSALNKGLNPLQRVKPESSLGKSAGIDKPMFLGIDLPKWNTNSQDYQLKETLIDTATEQQRRVESLSRIMAYYAISNQPFSVSAVLTGIGSLNIAENFDHTDKKMMQNLTWVTEELKKHILNSNEIDTTRSIQEWDTKIINEVFYQKALELAQQAKSISFTRKQIKQWQRAVDKSIRNSLGWNLEQTRVLQQYYPDRAVSTVFWHQLIIDHLTLVTFPLTSLTPRGDNFTGISESLALESNTGFRSSPPHIHEANLNILGHLAHIAKLQLQNLSLKKYEKLKSISQKLNSLYEPVAKHSYNINNKSGFRQYILDFFHYPFQWGQKIYEGKEQAEERVDPGFFMWKSLKLGVRFWSVMIPLGVLSREIFTPSYSLYANILGTFYFGAAGYIIFGLPQIWSAHHHLIFNKKTQETKDLISGIKLVHHHLQNKLYTSSSEMNTAYIEALLSFKKLYNKSKKFQRTVKQHTTIDPLIRDFISNPDYKESDLRKMAENRSIEEKTIQIERINSLLDTKNLPTSSNLLAYDTLILFTLGIWSNMFFVYVSNNSFKDVTFQQTLIWMMILFSGIYLYNMLSKKTIGQHLKYIKRKGKDAIRSIKNKCSRIFNNNIKNK